MVSKRSGSNRRQRTEQVTVRLTPAEHMVVMAAAADAHVAPATVLRNIFLSARQPRPPRPPAIPAYQRKYVHAHCCYCGEGPGRPCRTAAGGVAQFPHDWRQVMAAGRTPSDITYPVIPSSAPCASCGEQLRHCAGKELQWHRPDCPVINADG